MSKRAQLKVYFLIATFLIVAMQPLTPTTKAQKTITVPDDYTTIQEAINQANNGDTVYVKSGVYIENPIINKTINLKGENKDTTIIDVTEGIKIEKDNVTIIGFTIYDGFEAISIRTNNCIILENIIKDATRGIVVFGNQNKITKNIFYTIGLSSAIQLYWASNNLIQENYITSCTDAIQIKEKSHYNTIKENIIENIASTAIRIMASNNQLTKNSISNSKTALRMGSSYNVLSQNNFINNTLQYPYDDWYAKQWSQLIPFTPPVNTIDENFWSDYNGSDYNKDGKGDTPYIANDYSQDNYPLMNPVKIITNIYDPLIIPDPAPTPNLSIPPSPTLLPLIEPTPTSTPDNPQTTLPSTVEIALIVILVVVALGLAVNIAKKRRA